MKQFFIGRHHCLVDILPAVKYEFRGKPEHTVEYSGVESFEVLDTSTPEGRALEADMAASGLEADPFGEYLVLYFENGETATYRNSFVDLFHM